MSPNPHVLIVSLAPRWVNVARAPEMLRRNDFRVSGLCLEGGLLTFAGPFEHLITGPDIPSVTTRLTEALELVQPDLILPGDDGAVRFLHDVYVRPDLPATHRTLLERSLGDPTHYGDVDRKSAVMTLAAIAGYPVPRGGVADSMEAALSLAERVGFPLILKAETSAGGGGVKIIQNVPQMMVHYKALELRAGRAVRVSVQEYVQGPTASSTFCAWEGQLLAGYSWLREHPYPTPFSPASYVQLDRNSFREDMAARVVRAYGFSGLGSVQFVLDARRRTPYVMELNPRLTPVCNLGEHFGVNLFATLRACLTGEAPPSPTAPRYAKVALFPNALRRDPTSPELRDPTILHDIPADPTLRDAILKYGL